MGTYVKGKDGGSRFHYSFNHIHSHLIFKYLGRLHDIRLWFEEKSSIAKEKRKKKKKQLREILI